MAIALDAKSTGGTTTATLTCAAGDVIILFVTSNSTPPSSVSDNSGASTGWTQRGSYTGAGTSTAGLSMWWTVTTGAWSGKVITPTGGSGTIYACHASAWSGVNTASPFDTNVSLPAVSVNVNTVSINTTNANTVVLGAQGSGSGTGEGLGYTLLEGANFTTTEYQAFSSAQTGLSVNCLGSADGGFIADALVPAGAATVVRGFDYIVDDIYPKRSLSVSAAPAFVSTFRTAGIAGIAWQGPRDHAKFPPSVVFSNPPASPPRGPTPQTFGWDNQQEPQPLKKFYLDSAPALGRALTASPVGISGMAWDTLKEVDKLPKGGFLTDPAPVPFIPQTSTWSFLVGDTTFLRDAPMDSPPGFGQPTLAAPVGIAGMAWQAPLDWSKSRVSFTTPPAYAVNVAPIVNTNAGIPWFEPPDRDRPATKIRVESPIAYVRPPTVFTPISGIAWHEPLDLITVKPSFSYPPAFGREIVAPVPISGIAWFEPPPCTVKVAVSFSEAPALQQPIIQIEPPVVVRPDGGDGGKHWKAHYRARVKRYLEEQTRLQEEASETKAQAVKAKAKLKKLKKKSAIVDVPESKLAAALFSARDTAAKAEAAAIALKEYQAEYRDEIEDDDEEVLWMFMSSRL